MRWLVFLVLVWSVWAASQSQTTLSGGAQVSTGSVTPPPPPPIALTVTSSTCPSGFQPSYNCTLLAAGGTPPYTWSGTPPFGLTLSASGVISGSASSTGTSVFTATVTDSAGPPATASAQVSITIQPTPTGCGFPTYNCSRTDYQTVVVTSNGTLPPAAGCQTAIPYVSGELHYKPCGNNPHPCTAGMVEDSSNPLLPVQTGATNAAAITAMANHASNLQNCGNIYGLNTIVTDPRYNNVRMVRLTDRADQDNGGCRVPHAFSAVDASSVYIGLGSSGGGTCGIKWFDYASFQVNTSKNSGGWVLCPASGSPLPLGCASNGAVWKPPRVQEAGAPPGNLREFPGLTGTNLEVIDHHITDGVVDLGAPVITNFSYGVPCWSDVSAMTSVNGSPVGTAGAAVPMCEPWTQGKTYPGGSVIVPTTNNAAGCNPSSAPANCHSFQLINNQPCTAGASEPYWLIPLINGANGKPGVEITSAVLTSGIATYTYIPRAGWPAIVVGQRVSISGATPAAFNTPVGSMAASGAAGETAWAHWTVTAVTANTFSVAISAADIAATAQTTARTTPIPDGVAVSAGSTIGGATRGAAVIHDGTCRWADMRTPILPTGTAKWTAGAGGDATGTVMFLTMSNNGSQDDIGACFIVAYNIATKTYSHVNTCTGNVYNTVCNGGSDYQCTSGNWTRTFLGNLYDDNLFWAVGVSHTSGLNQRISRFVMHGGSISPGGQFATTSANNCGLADTNGGIECWAGAPQYIQGGSYYWLIGTVKFADARTAINTCCPGHATTGFNTQLRATQGYSVRSTASLVQIMPWDLNQTVKSLVWDASVGPCTAYPLTGVPSIANGGCIEQQCPSVIGAAPAGSTQSQCDLKSPVPVPNGVSDCLSDPCWGTYNVNTSTGLTSLIGKRLQWDWHQNWRSNPGTDDTPICANTYVGSKSIPQSAWLTSQYGSGYKWPPWAPWGDELVCYATNGTNKMFRMANQWNTASELWFYPMYGYNMGTKTGQFQVITSDMWCTIGGSIWQAWNSGTAVDGGVTIPINPSATTVVCGLPFQAGHHYSVGEYVVPSLDPLPTLRCESMVFKVTQAGTTGLTDALANMTCGNFTAPTGIPPALPVTDRWNCAGAASSSVTGTLGCQVQSGDVIFTYIGRSNQIPAAFAIDLQ